MNKKTYFLIFLSALMAQPTTQGSVSVFKPQRSLPSTESVLNTLERRGIGGLNQTARLLKSNKGWVIGLTTLAGIITFPSYTVFLTALSGCFLIYIYGWEFFETIFQLIKAPYNALMAMLLGVGLGRGPASWIALLVYLSVLVAIVVYARTYLKLKKDRKDTAEALRARLRTEINGEKSLAEKEKLAKIKALVFLAVLFSLTLIGLKADSSGLPDPPRHPIVIKESNPKNNSHNPLLSQDEANDIEMGVSVEIAPDLLQEAQRQSPSPDNDHEETSLEDLQHASNSPNSGNEGGVVQPLVTTEEMERLDMQLTMIEKLLRPTQIKANPGIDPNLLCSDEEMSESSEGTSKEVLFPLYRRKKGKWVAQTSISYTSDLSSTSL